ncbi:MAG: UDP-N-acetylmuramoyl-L-alanine--D-glutamate ligase [Polyangiaceae bacterium]
MFDLRGKEVVVVGLGTSGVAAARLCLARGARVIGTDAKSNDALGNTAMALMAQGAEVRGGSVDDANFSKADLVVVSPGVPNFPKLVAAEKTGVKIIGEVELSFICRKFPCPVAAIGGTNGKSTVTTLVAALLEGAGKKVFAGGNLGEPWANHVDEEFDFVVLEVSSFQMERIDVFHPNAAALLNVTPDHLDRYDGIDAYAHAKGNFFVRQTPGDAAIIPVNDDICLREAKRGKARIVTFGSAGQKGADQVVSAEFPGLRGGHNKLNAAAAVAVVDGLGQGVVDQATIARVFGSFRALPHRMELVGEIGGIKYYDDSKGTNVGASVTALRGLSENKAVLIAGGRDKGGSYEPLAQALVDRGRAVVVIGEAASIIADVVGDRVAVRRAATMEEAVNVASVLAKAGDAVLLSPACSSFDMFRDYKHRGDDFTRAVLEIEKSHKNTGKIPNDPE